MAKKVRGKEVAVGAITAGEILLHLTEQLSDLSEVNPAVHLEALRNQFGHNDELVRAVATYIDKLIFWACPLTIHSKAADKSKVYVELSPCEDVRFIEAALWAKQQGYSYVGRDELLSLGSFYLKRYVGSPTLMIIEEQGDNRFRVGYRYDNLSDKSFTQVNPAETLLYRESYALVVSSAIPVTKPKR